MGEHYEKATFHRDTATGRTWVEHWPKLCLMSPEFILDGSGIEVDGDLVNGAIVTVRTTDEVQHYRLKRDPEWRAWIAELIDDAPEFPIDKNAVT